MVTITHPDTVAVNDPVKTVLPELFAHPMFVRPTYEVALADSVITNMPSAVVFDIVATLDEEIHPV
jgi:hypothetical protein